MNNNNGTSNLLSLTEAKLKYQQNQRRILKFLNQEKYSTARILQQIIGLKNTIWGLPGLKPNGARQLH